MLSQKEKHNPTHLLIEYTAGAISHVVDLFLLYFKLTLCKSMVECSQSIPPAFICATHLETLTCLCHCTICDICSRLQYQAEAHTVKGSRSEGEATIMTSLACSTLTTIGPGVLLRRGTHGCAPFSQHSACNIVFPIHNATLHTGFITPCQSAGGSGVSVREQQETGLSTWSRRCGGAL